MRGASIVALALATSCHVWKVTELGPSQQFVNGKTRIARVDGSQVIIRGPHIAGDSIVGTHATTQAQVALARSDVKRVEVERISRGRTAALGAVLFALYWAVQIATISDTRDYSSP